MMTDPIADMLTRLRNASAARHPTVVMPASKLKTEIARVLREEGYIRGFDVQEDKGKRVLRVHLRYTDKKQPMLLGLERVSRPGLRVYTKRDTIPRVFGGVGTAILSTPRGVMTGEQARRLGVGGEILCKVW
ncbi:MAG: 30S ribosomal protein S8 [Chloroflexi bacterium]|nr:30S ribosomal protein S8 [Chloroflexota bacterium]